MKDFIGTCVSNPFESLDELEVITDNAREVDKREFLDICEIDDEIKAQMREYPHDYGFYKSGDIYFYTWSCIEHFFA